MTYGIFTWDHEENGWEPYAVGLTLREAVRRAKALCNTLVYSEVSVLVCRSDRHGEYPIVTGVPGWEVP